MQRSILSRFICLGAGAAALLGPVATAQPFALTEQSFYDPAFRQRFVESYLVDSELNPKISPNERALFEEITPLIQSDPTLAISRLRSSITPDSSAAFDFILGNLLYQEGELEGAVAAYLEAIRKFPSYHRAYDYAGRAYVATGDFENGLVMLQKSLSLKPGDGSTYGLLGYCYLNGERFASALDAYRMAIMLAPNSRDWKLGKLQCLIALNETDEAIGMLYEFIANDPDNAEWWKIQANQFLALDEPSKAAANLTIVKEMGKADAPALVLLGDILLNEGIYEGALDSYEGALATGRVRPDRILRVVENLIVIEELSSAASLVAAVEQSFPNQLEEESQLTLLNLKAQIAMAEDDIDSAAGFLEEIVQKDPMNGQALLSLSDFHAEKDDLAQAEFYAENATKVEAVAHQAYLKLAQLKVQQRDYREAAKYLRNAQSISPRDYVADYLMKVEQAALRM